MSNIFTNLDNIEYSHNILVYFKILPNLGLPFFYFYSMFTLRSHRCVVPLVASSLLNQTSQVESTQYLSILHALYLPYQYRICPGT